MRSRSISSALPASIASISYLRIFGAVGLRHHSASCAHQVERHFNILGSIVQHYIKLSHRRHPCRPPLIMPNLVISSIISSVAFCVAFVFFGLVKRYYEWLTSPLNRIPGPTHRFLLGAMLDIQKEPFMAPHKRWWKQAVADAAKRGDDANVPMIHYTTMFGAQSVVVLDPDIVKQILTAPASKEMRFPKRMVWLKKTLGNGLVTLEGPDWSRHRRTIQPSFSVGSLKLKLGATVPFLVDRLVDQWRVAEGREIDVASHLSALALDIIGDVAFSHDFNALDVVEDWASNSSSNQLAEVDDPLINNLLESLKPNFLRMLMRQTGLGHLHHALDPKTRETQRLLNEAVDKVIDNARESVQRERENGEEVSASTSSRRSNSGKSLLQLLLDAKVTQPGVSSRTLTPGELRDEMKTFLVAGHETTATWCYWALFALAKHKDIQRRVYEEILKHAPRSPNDPISLEATENMTYFAAFLQEVLRLYPPVGMILRYSSREETFAGYTVPKDTRLVISPHLLHRHPTYWKGPMEFRPERWLEKDKMKNNAFAFLPFSGGGRNCIGQHFARMEVRLILAPIIRAFSIEIAPSQSDTQYQFSSYITMKSKPGIKVCVRRRKE